MPKGTSNSWAKLDIRLDVDRQDVENMIGHYIDAKQEAIRRVFKQVGNMYKKELSSLMGPNFGELQSKFFKFKTEQSKGGNIALLAGIMDQANFDKTSNYLRFWLYGTEKHWVSLKKHEDVAAFGLRVGIIYEANDGNYYYTKTNERAWALQISNRSHVMEVKAIQRQLIKELLRRLEQL